MSAPHHSNTSYRFSHPLMGPFLPPPGRMPAWPFAEIGHWHVDVAAEADDWRRGLAEWRAEHLLRIGYDDAQYRRPETRWAQANFVHTVVMVEDRLFYDPDAQRYTVDRYLDELEARIGRVDSALLWQVYPNIGIDDRNHFDLLRDLPGGTAGLAGAVADFHRRGVRVFLATAPWDNGTRAEPGPHWTALAELLADSGADGINGDTYHGVPTAFLNACAAHDHPVVAQPENMAHAGDHALAWNVQSWLKRVPTGPIPSVPKLKWLEPRHIQNIENRWSSQRTNDLQHAFFAGLGYNAWENVFGTVNRFTPRDAETLRRVARIQRRFAALLVAPDWEPYAATLQPDLYGSRWPGERETLWTLVNRNEYPLAGEAIGVPHRVGARYFDLWAGCALTPRIVGDRALLSLPFEGHGFGAVLAVDGDAVPDDLAAFLADSAAATGPLGTLSATWRALPQAIVPVAPTARRADAPAGMVAIPAGEFDFVVQGIEIEGFTQEGLDVQYPWEPSPRRRHRHRMAVAAFHIDRHPVTNADYARFLADSGYRPADPANFLRHWIDGAPPPGAGDRPVTWVGIEDARAYAAWAGKRLPREWEWQYAAQGTDGRRYPWGGAWDAAAVPPVATGRAFPDLSPVGCHPRGASPFGVEDLVGTIWQWTDEFRDDRTRAAVLRGGSPYQPQTSHWYFPQGYALDQHGKYLLMAPCRDRSAGIGFRCVVDA